MNEEKWWGLNAEFLGNRTYEMHQFYDYNQINLHQNWRTDHKHALKQYNQAAVAVIKTKSLCNIFLGHPVVRLLLFLTVLLTVLNLFFVEILWSNMSRADSH